MRSISLWAYHHKWAARLSLIFAYILINFIAIFFTIVLNEHHTSIPKFIPYLLCIPFLIAFVLYPSHREKSRYKHFYAFRKTLDSILITVSFLLIICTADKLFNGSDTYRSSGAIAMESTIKPKKPLSKITVKVRGMTFLVKHWKQLKTNYQLFRKAYRDTSKGAKIALIVLAILVSVSLLFLVAALSCNLSCSGNEGAALVVLLLGTGLICFLLAKVIQAITKPKQKDPSKNVNKV
jgi:hypothetical protein